MDGNFVRNQYLSKGFNGQKIFKPHFLSTCTSRFWWSEKARLTEFQTTKLHFISYSVVMLKFEHSRFWTFIALFDIYHSVSTHWIIYLQYFPLHRYLFTGLFFCSATFSGIKMNTMLPFNVWSYIHPGSIYTNCTHVLFQWKQGR